MTITVGLIGYGLAGSTFHAPLIRATPGLTLTTVMTSRDVPGLAVVSDAQSLFDRVALVVIASPNQSHFPLALEALRAGKHVVVDKPMTVTVEQADALIAAQKASGATLTVFHNRRWDGDYLTLRDVLAGGRLGPVTLYQAHWDRLRPAIKQGWRESEEAGAGLLNDLGPHLIDQALQLFGWPDAISADIVTQRAEARADDYFALTLYYGAMRAILSASTLVAAPRPRFALHGAAGSFVKYGLDPQENALKAGAQPNDPDFGEDSVHNMGVLTDATGAQERVPTQKGCYLSFYAGVVDAIQGAAAVPVDPADARRGLLLLDRARESQSSGRRITLDVA